MSMKNILYVLALFSLVLLYQNCAPGFESLQPQDGQIDGLSEGNNLSAPNVKGPTVQPVLNKLCTDSNDVIAKSHARRLTLFEIEKSIEDLLGQQMDVSKLPSDSVNKYLLTRDGSTQSLIVGDAEKFYDQYELTINKYIQANKTDLVTCKATTANEINNCVNTYLYPLIYQAWRRPLTSADKNKVQSFFSGGDYLMGLKSALLYTFLSPKFLYVAFESSGNNRNLSNYEIVERLSFLIWGSVPNLELLTMAQNNKLQTKADLETVITLMFNDKKRSKRFFQAFMNDWIGLDELHHTTRKDKKFTPQLAQELEDEAVHFFEDLFRNNEPIHAMFESQYTVASRDVASLYGVNWDSSISWQHDLGQSLRRIKLPENRKGILTTAGVLTRTAAHDETASPTQRGYWATKKVTCIKPGAVPEDVDLEIKPIEGSFRQQLENHVKAENCQSCHALMDPIGFGLGNFNTLGEFITKDGFGYDIDASGEILSKSFNNATDLVDIFVEDQNVKDCFTSHFTSFVITKASDTKKSCTQQKIRETVDATGGGLKDFLVEIITSKLFLTEVVR